MKYEPSVLDGKHVYASVDGTDCPINEPHPFSPGWYSHKFRGPGVRYEVALSVSSGKIIWVNGPFRCGTHPDNKIFQTDMKKALSDDEFVIADKGYTDSKCINTVSSSTGSHMHRIVRARHETVNARLKNFNVIYHSFRHDISKHWACFHAVAQITAIMIDTTNPLFEI